MAGTQIVPAIREAICRIPFVPYTPAHSNHVDVHVILDEISRVVRPLVKHHNLCREGARDAVDKFNDMMSSLVYHALLERDWDKVVTKMRDVAGAEGYYKQSLSDVAAASTQMRGDLVNLFNVRRNCGSIPMGFRDIFKSIRAGLVFSGLLTIDNELVTQLVQTWVTKPVPVSRVNYLDAKGNVLHTESREVRTTKKGVVSLEDNPSGSSREDNSPAPEDVPVERDHIAEIVEDNKVAEVNALNEAFVALVTKRAVHIGAARQPAEKRPRVSPPAGEAPERLEAIDAVQPISADKYITWANLAGDIVQNLSYLNHTQDDIDIWTTQRGRAEAQLASLTPKIADQSAEMEKLQAQLDRATALHSQLCAVQQGIQQAVQRYNERLTASLDQARHFTETFKIQKASYLALSREEREQFDKAYGKPLIIKD